VKIKGLKLTTEDDEIVITDGIYAARLQLSEGSSSSLNYLFSLHLWRLLGGLA